MEHAETLIFNYSNIFFSYYFNDDIRCHKMIEDHSLAYIYAGEMLAEKGSEKTKIHKGQCVFIRKDHRLTLTKKAKDGQQFQAIFMVFNRKFLRDFFYSLDKSEIPTDIKKIKNSLVKLPNNPEIESLFESLKPYFNSTNEPREQIMNLKLQEGIYTLLNIDPGFYSCLFDFTEPWKIDILDFMDKNYMYDFSIEDIANYTGRSLASFKRDFRKISFLSPQKWLMEKRLKVAYDKLKIDNKKVSDVYHEVGFKNLSHFSTAFKKRFGVAPTQ